MQVIEEKPFEYDFECCKCKSRLVANENDVEYGDFSSALVDGHHYCFYVVCPVCNADNIITRSYITPKVEQLAKSKRR